MPIDPHPFKGCECPGEVIVLCVGWYLRFPLATSTSGSLAERAIALDAGYIWRWAQPCEPKSNKRCRERLKTSNKNCRIDETYIKVKGEDKYLYRALDSRGQTIDFLLTDKRDTAAAKRFLCRVIETSSNPMPWVIKLDKNPAYPAAMETLKPAARSRRLASNEKAQAT